MQNKMENLIISGEWCFLFLFSLPYKNKSEKVYVNEAKTRVAWLAMMSLSTPVLSWNILDE